MELVRRASSRAWPAPTGDRVGFAAVGVGYAREGASSINASPSIGQALAGLFAGMARSYRGWCRCREGHVLSRTQNNVAPATAAGIMMMFTPGISSAA